MNNKLDFTVINSAESFARYVCRDHTNTNIDSVNESKNILSFNSYIWLFIIRMFNVMIINKHSYLFKDGNENMLMVYKNLFYSSRNQFACIFMIERQEEVKGQLKVIINSWLILKSRNKVMEPVNDITTNIVNYGAVQTWIFSGNFILEDLVIVFKFYQIWDCKAWYCPLELDVMDGFKF
jgi:hypothetical protein